jgi:beta-lactamase class D
VVWYFREIARRIGAERMQAWVQRLQYGNCRVEAPFDGFWLEGPLAISPVEQADFHRRLWADQLPARKENQALVRSLLPREVDGQLRITFKTGFGILNEQGVAWRVGTVEGPGARRAHFAAVVCEREDVEEEVDVEAAVKDVAWRGVKAWHSPPGESTPSAWLRQPRKG